MNNMEVINRTLLPVILNNTNGGVIKYPLMDMELINISDDLKVLKSLTTWEGFMSTRSKYAKTTFLRRDLPKPADILEAMVSSGVVRFKNADEIDNIFSEMLEDYTDPKRHPRSVYIGIDTNIAYYRYITRFLKHTDFRFVISGIVVDEIDSRIHSKYQRGWIADMKKFLRAPEFVGEFLNGSTRESRRAKNAMTEVMKIIKEYQGFRIDVHTDEKDKEVRDRLIIESYRSFAEEMDANVVVLTADKDMVFHCEAQGLPVVFFELPHEIPSKIEASMENIVDFIYDMAVIFGVVELDGIEIFGEFLGKSADDYYEEQLQISNIKESTRKDIKITQTALEKLK